MAETFRPPRTLGLVALALGIIAVAASAAYGITMDTKPGHKHQLIGLTPPAPAPPAAVPPTASNTPPKATAPAPKPPKVSPSPPVAPHAATPAPPAVAPSHGGGSSSTGGSSAGGGSSSGGSTHHSSPGTSHSGTGSSNGSAGFSTGDTPTAARAFPPGSGNDDQAARAADDDPSTAWTTKQAPSGIFVDAGGYTTYTALGIVTKTPGYSVQVFATQQDPPPGQTSSWTLVGSASSVSSRQKIKITQQPPSGDWRYYLIWVTKLPKKGSAAISEVALLQ